MTAGELPSEPRSLLGPEQEWLHHQVVRATKRRYRLADELKRARRFEAASRQQEIALRLDPRHAGANRQMAEICVGLKRMAAARRYADAAFETDPNDAEIRLLVSRLEGVADPVG